METNSNIVFLMFVQDISSANVNFFTKSNDW